MSAVAKYQSRCAACDQLIHAGEAILPARGASKHWTCPPKLKRKPERFFPYILRDRDASGRQLPSKTCPDCGERVQLLQKDQWDHFTGLEMHDHWNRLHGGGA